MGVIRECDRFMHNQKSPQAFWLNCPGLCKEQNKINQHVGRGGLWGAPPRCVLRLQVICTVTSIRKRNIQEKVRTTFNSFSIWTVLFWILTRIRNLARIVYYTERYFLRTGSGQTRSVQPGAALSTAHRVFPFPFPEWKSEGLGGRLRSGRQLIHRSCWSWKELPFSQGDRKGQCDWTKEAEGGGQD